MFSTTLFLCIRFHPSGCQLLTTGTNRQIAYWETFDGALIREIEGSRSAALNTLDISSDGVYVASGGNDQYVKLWLYKEGIPIYIGLGHGAVITAVSISPDGRTIVSASADGAIFIWRSPTDPETKTESKTTVSTPHSQQSKEKLPVSKEKSRTPSRARLAKLKFSDSHSSKCEREEKSYFSTKHTFWKHYFFSSKESVGSKNESDVKKELAKACRGMESVKGKLEKIKAEREAAELASVKNEDSCDEDQGGAGDSKMCGKYSSVSPRLEFFTITSSRFRRSLDSQVGNQWYQQSVYDKKNMWERRGENQLRRRPALQSRRSAREKGRFRRRVRENRRRQNRSRQRFGELDEREGFLDRRDRRKSRTIASLVGRFEFRNRRGICRFGGSERGNENCGDCK
ncbi:unnamed protein product [Nesidiocoris tenuis]|uniref:Uncharacterized protein n=1 Tax=Nesidiocoris tenuis TaxID=355587 RepID=A0A6H5HU72_9HEMI|nr:unnamed protein product [Nesidiocoris tenuis]